MPILRTFAEFAGNNSCRLYVERSASLAGVGQYQLNSLCLVLFQNGITAEQLDAFKKHVTVPWAWRCVGSSFFKETRAIDRCFESSHPDKIYLGIASSSARPAGVHAYRPLSVLFRQTIRLLSDSSALIW